MEGFVFTGYHYGLCEIWAREQERILILEGKVVDYYIVGELRENTPPFDNKELYRYK